MRIYAICGKKGSGKSMVSEAIEEAMPLTRFSSGCAAAPAIRIPLAEPLKDMLTCLPGITSAHVGGPFKEVIVPSLGFTPRDMMQKLGTAMKREFGETFWLKCWNVRFCSVVNNKNAQAVIVDDVRFPFEYEYFRKSGATMILCTNGIEGDSHESESTVWLPENFDHVFEKNDEITSEAKKRLVVTELIADGHVHLTHLPKLDS